MQSKHLSHNIRSLLPLILIISACPVLSRGGVVQMGSTDTLLIAFTANNNGQLLDCGCDVEIPGGLPRRQTALSQLRRVYGDILLLDGGDLFSPTKKSRQNQFVLGAYDAMRYHAIAIGDQELWAGQDDFSKVVSKTKTPFLGTNLPEGFPSGRVMTHLSLVKNGFDLLILAILHPSSFAYYSGSKIPSLEVEHMRKTLSGNLEEPGYSDALIIVLFHGNRDALEGFRKEFPQVSLWFLGHEPSVAGRAFESISLPAVVTGSSNGESIELVKIVRNKDKITASARRLPLDEEIEPDAELTRYLEQFNN